jgi:hypothetical protein
MDMGRATRNDHSSGARTARVFGASSAPSKIKMSRPARDGSNGQLSNKASQSKVAIIPALANVLPRTIVASKSCGCARRRETTGPRLGEFTAIWRVCHLPSENKADSASAKKKLAAAKMNSIAKAAIGITGKILNKKTVRQRKIAVSNPDNLHANNTNIVPCLFAARELLSTREWPESIYEPFSCKIFGCEQKLTLCAG